MLRADLHLHSTYSDGVLSPRQLVQRIREAGISVMSLTDHDTFAGADELSGEKLPVRLITGCELSMAEMHSLHLLVYGNSEGLHLRRAISRLAENREERARAMVSRLQKLGVDISWESIRDQTAGVAGRPHLARAIVQAGYVRTIHEAFERYLGENKPAYIPAERLTIAEALRLAAEDRFIPVLAHPCELKLPDETLSALITRWQELGLRGIEVYHPSAGGRFETLDRMARRRKLLVTGGSDFHQEDCGHHGGIGSMCECWHSCEEDIQALEEAMNRGNG